MAEHARARRTPVQWLRDDLRRGIGLRRGARLVRREPMLLVWISLYAGVSVAAAALILLIVGRTDLFPYGALFGAMFGGGLVSGRAEQALARHPDLQR